MIGSMLLLLLSVISSSLYAQGIKFENNLTWEQVLAKAKAEHKYIFLDCYATWCGPCKSMDSEVYPQKTVGDVFNENFISMKMQFDKTPTDNEEIKKFYGVSTYLQNTYAVNAFPTFLFFDPDGNPVHKTAGYYGREQFIQLASDAKNPDKQYYQILKNYQEGSLDTAELKGLARTFKNQDKNLSAKLASDYLNRIPKEHLNSKDNLRLMIEFQSDPTVLAIAASFLKSLNKEQMDKGIVLNFVSKLQDQPVVKKIALDYIKTLNDLDLGLAVNQNFIRDLRRDSLVREIAKNYIERAPESLFETATGVRFVTSFMDDPKGKSFQYFYRHPSKINKVMGDYSYAGDYITITLVKTQFGPFFENAKKTGIAPIWQTLFKEVEKKYTTEYADRVVLDSKLAWCKYMIDTKKDERYWPTYIDCQLKQITKYRYDTIGHGDYKLVNGYAYLNGFYHATDPKQLNSFLKLMKDATDKHPDDYGYMDTYACLLYKAGRIEEAIACDKKAVYLGESQFRLNVDAVRANLAKMEKGEKFWLEKN